MVGCDYKTPRIDIKSLVYLKYAMASTITEPTPEPMPESITEPTPEPESELSSFLKQVDAFRQEYHPMLTILTPCFGGTVNINYTVSLIQTIQLFQQVQIPLGIEFCQQDSLICRARSNLVAKAMSEPRMTHFIFIDADISWQALDVLKLLLHNKNVVGGAYPLKNYNWNRLDGELGHENLRKWIHENTTNPLWKNISNEKCIRYHLVNYNIAFNSEESIEIHNNLTQVKRLATGFLMMKRTVIEHMIEENPNLKYKDNIGFLTKKDEPFAYAFFDSMVMDGYYESEDFVFCNRWKSMGGTIYLDISVVLNHFGTECYAGNLLNSLGVSLTPT